VTSTFIPVAPEEGTDDTGVGVVQLIRACHPHDSIVYMHDVTLGMLLLSPHY